MDSNLLYTNALPYIDVSPPYFALRDLSLLPNPPSTDYPAVSATFSREQIPPPQNAKAFCSSELGRHTAILGSIAAAYSNSVKAKQYYLASEAIVEFSYVPMSQELRGEARIVHAEWEKCRVSCEIKLQTLEGKFAGKIKVSYVIVTEPQLLKTLKPVKSNRVLGTEWRPEERSPYIDPFMLRMIKSHSPDFVTAVISLHDSRFMAGHFSVRATAPIAILCSNGILLCRRLLKEGHGKRWLDQKTRVRCYRLAVAGELLEWRARKHDQEGYSPRVEFWDENGKMMGMVDHLFVEVDAGERASRLYLTPGNACLDVGSTVT